MGFSQTQVLVREDIGEGLDIELLILDLTSDGEVDPDASLPLTLELQEAQGETIVTCMHGRMDSCYHGNTHVGREDIQLPIAIV